MLARDKVELRKLYEQVEEQQQPIGKNAYLAELVMQHLDTNLARTEDPLNRDSPDQTDFPEHGTLGDKSNYKVVPRTRHCPLTHSNSPLS